MRKNLFTYGVTLAATLSVMAGGKANPSDRTPIAPAQGASRAPHYSRTTVRQPHLYVANYYANSITEYPPDQSTVTRTITNGIAGPIAIVFDSSGNLYVANQQTSQVTVYGPERSQPLRIISLPAETALTAMAIDEAAHLFLGTSLSNTESSVVEYAPGSGKVLNAIQTGSSGANQLAVDASGNLFVASDQGNSVTEYAAGSLQLMETIAASDPQAMAFDGFGNLYVADSSLNSIEVYAPGSNQPLRTITDGVQQPIALVFDPAGNLCVGGVALNEYAPGKFYPKRTIAYNTISRSFAFDDVGRLYADDDGGAILVYSPVTYKLVNTISAGVNFALAIAFGL